MARPPKKNKTQDLSQQDCDLWEEVKKTVKPLNVKGGSDAAKPAIQPRRMIDRKAEARALPHEWYTHSSPEPEARIHRKTRRRLASGNQYVDRAIDLHGMTQDQAYHMLKGAIEGGIRRGDKTLLVVTGKGGRRFSQLGGDTPTAYRRREDFDQHGGVLKKMVPIWLQSHEMRAFVESFDVAAQEHGGDGALYVLLRKRLPGSKKNR
jgi:DNA-nicking Smr family endonuclease